MYSALQNNYLWILHSAVTGNAAESIGGGVYMGESHERVRFDEVEISENTATEKAGGAYFARFSSEIILSGCHIANNTAGTAGGLLVLADDMLIASCLVENNMALENYGALYAESSNSFEVISSNFSLNIAHSSCGRRV